MLMKKRIAKTIKNTLRRDKKRLFFGKITPFCIAKSNKLCYNSVVLMEDNNNQGEYHEEHR